MQRLPQIPHVKTKAPATHEMIQHFHSEGWLGQMRPKGDLIKILISASGGVLFSQDRLASKLDMISMNMLQGLFRPAKDWNAFLAVRQQGTNSLWLLDCLMEDGVPLLESKLPERLARIPSNFISPIIKNAPTLKTVRACMDAVSNGHHILFRHPAMPGWHHEGMALLTAL